MKKERKIRIFQFSREFCLLIYFFLLSNIFVSFFFFFCFHSEQILIFAGVQWDLFQSTQRSAIFVSITTILYQKRSDTFFSSFVWEREKSSRERIIPLTDNNFSLKSLIFLKHFHPRFKYFLEPTPFCSRACFISSRWSYLITFFHWINAKVLCEREKRVYIYIKSRRRKDRNSRHVPRSFQGGNRTRHS